MNRSETRSRRLAFALIELAIRLLPGTRIEWAKAMLSELYYLENDRKAVLWAVGCLVASIKERVSAMVTGNLKISRWILVPEMLLCFVPLTIGWLDSVGGASGIIRLNMEIIQKYFFGVPGGTAALAMMVSGAILGVLGPVGLIAAMRLIALGRPISRWLGTTLIVGPVLLGGTIVVARFIMDSELAVSREMVLICVLPALGAAHMLHLGPRTPDVKTGHLVSPV